MTAPGWRALVVAGLVLASLPLGCSRVERGKDRESVIQWVPAGQPLPAANPGPSAAPPQSARPGELACPSAPAFDNRDLVAAIEKVAEACRAPAFPPEAQSPSPAEAAPVSWPPAGPQVVDALAAVLAGMGQSPLGFRINDLVIGRLLDNGTSEQEGEIEAVRAYLGWLSARAAPPNADPLAAARASLLEGNLGKWWFPSGEKTLARGMAALEETSAAMKSGAIRSPGGPQDLKDFLLASSSLLSGQAGMLSGGSVADADRAFYRARGTAAAVSAALQGAEESYAAALKDRGAGDDLKRALDSLNAARAMDPLVVLAGPPGSLRANHLLLLAYDLGRAADALSAAAARLE
jgi:hypothetical protein